MKLARTQIFSSFEISITGGVRGRYVLARIPTMECLERTLLVAIPKVDGRFSLSADKTELYVFVDEKSIEELVIAAEKNFERFKKLKAELYNFDKYSTALTLARG